MKKVAVIQDLSSFGKCSLTAAIPVLSVMGSQPCPLPTAVLSAQTEFPSYFCEDLTAHIPHFINEWKKLHVSFDGIQIGYMTGERQIDHILQLLKTFHTAQTVLLVDPVMGDTGEAYSNFDGGMLARMKKLIAHADIVTPNVTECCLLTGLSYDSLHRCRTEQEFLQVIEQAGRTLQQQTGAKIIITGIIPPAAEQTIGNMYIDGAKVHYSASSFNGKSYSGTGDLFSSILMGSVMRGDSLLQAVELAETFISASITNSALAGVPAVEGVHFENQLPMLWRM